VQGWQCGYRVAKTILDYVHVCGYYEGVDNLALAKGSSQKHLYIWTHIITWYKYLQYGVLFVEWNVKFNNVLLGVVAPTSIIRTLNYFLIVCILNCKKKKSCKWVFLYNVIFNILIYTFKKIKINLMNKMCTKRMFF
jgi:hypothetical protein